MQSEINIQEKEPKNVFFAVTVCECILAATLIITVTVLKFFAPAAFVRMRGWYSENAAADQAKMSAVRREIIACRGDAEEGDILQGRELNLPENRR